MNQLFTMAVLLLTLAPQSQDFPDAFYQIPEQVREKATVVISGTFGEGRSPCIFLPDGTRVWARESWFNLKKVQRGKVGGKTIAINTAMLPETEYVSRKLERGRDYLVLLRPDSESMKMIREGQYLSFREALCSEEIIAIVELK
jgi:hypothetical protein